MKHLCSFPAPSHPPNPTQYKYKDKSADRSALIYNTCMKCISHLGSDGVSLLPSKLLLNQTRLVASQFSWLVPAGAPCCWCGGSSLGYPPVFQPAGVSCKTGLKNGLLMRSASQTLPLAWVRSAALEAEGLSTHAISG